MSAPGREKAGARTADRGGHTPEAWQRIWGDALGSTRPDSADRRLLETWWTEELGALAQVTRSLEIGAGAVPLPSLCLARLRPGIEIVVSDYRDCAAAEDPRLSRVADAPIEALPFEPATFDLVLSQFAFEYAEPAAAARDVRRILRTGGAALLAVHHGGGFFADYLRHRMAFLESGAGVAATIGARALAREVRRGRLRQALRRIETLLPSYLAAPEHRDVADDLIDLRAIIESALAGRDLDASQTLILSQLAPALVLAQAQLAAGFTAGTIDQLAARLGDAGFEPVRIAPIASGDRQLAWGVHAIAR